MTQSALKMERTPFLLEPLAGVCICPRCSGSLLPWQDTLECKKCKIHYRTIDGIPWLFEHSERIFWDWKYEIENLFKTLDSEIHELQGEQKKPKLLVTTKTRLDSLLEARLQLKTHYRTLFTPFLSAKTQPLPWGAIPQAKIPLGTGIGSYNPNLFRDWCWGDEENKLSLNHVQEAIGGSLKGKSILVLGGGSSRLAYDLHETCHPSLTVVVDHHPLHLLSAHALVKGKELHLYEFPMAPRSLEKSAILRTLKAPKAVSPDFYLIFADGTHPPFKSESFDFILTPWFIDVVPGQLPINLKRIHRVLKPGGSWVHFGPFGFPARPFSECYGTEEVLELTKTCGYEIQSHSLHTIPYLRCPESLHSRLETVHVIKAKKVGSSGLVEKTPYLPSFLTNPQEPIPVLPEFVTAFQSAQTAEALIGLIDGKRSLNDIAQMVAIHTKAPEDVTRASVLALLTFVLESERAKKRF